MSFVVTDAGRRFLATMLSGSPDRIDGMYVEYGGSRAAVSRDSAYYAGLDGCDSCGYARVAVSNTSVDASNTVCFNAVVDMSDFKHAYAESLEVSGIALVHLGSTKADDIVVATMSLERPVTVTKGAYTTVHARMSLG